MSSCYFCEKPVEMERLIALDARPNATTAPLCHNCNAKLDRFTAFLKSLWHEK